MHLLVINSVCCILLSDENRKTVMGKYFLKDFFVQSRDLKDNTQNEAILSTKNLLYSNFLKTCFEQHSPHPLISNFQKSVAKCPFFNLRKLPVLLSPEFIFFISNKQLKLLIL